MNWFEQLIGPITLPESNRIYHDMDTNKSGTITFDEVITPIEYFELTIFSLVLNIEYVLDRRFCIC